MNVRSMTAPDLERLRAEIDAELARRLVEVTSASTREELLAAARELERRAGVSESAKQRS